jgi:hypothetical protein
MPPVACGSWTRLTASTCSSGVFVWVFVYKANTPDEHAAARSLAEFGSVSGPRKGVPASPLRSGPGDPLPRPTNITDVQVKSQIQSDEGKASGQQHVEVREQQQED